MTLTTAELLKNYFFTRRDIEAYKQDWYEVFEKDEETRNYWDTEITTGRTKRTYIDMCSSLVPFDQDPGQCLWSERGRKDQVLKV